LSPQYVRDDQRMRRCGSTLRLRAGPHARARVCSARSTRPGRAHRQRREESAAEQDRPAPSVASSERAQPTPPIPASCARSRNADPHALARNGRAVAKAIRERAKRLARYLGLRPVPDPAVVFPASDAAPGQALPGNFGGKEGIRGAQSSE
jgi:hypothetical protein